MKKLLLCTVLLFIFALAACGDKDENTTTNDVETETNTKVDTNTKNEAGTNPATQETEEDQEDASWQNEIALIVSNEGTASDKYTELQTLMTNYEATPDEVEQFKNDIISDYEAKRYLGDLKNDEYMLSMLLKTYVVEQNNQGAPLGDFASDMYENLKNTYVGGEDMNSESVKAKEAQMDGTLRQIDAGS